MNMINAIPLIALVIGAIGIVVIIVVLMLYFMRSRKVNLTQTTSPDEKPVWMQTMPPPETIAATQADGEGITSFDHDPGEAIAAPFAEQIEDIINAKLQADPTLSSYVVDLGTSPEGELTIDINGTIYTSIEDIPNEQLRQTLRAAIDKWERHI